MLTRRYFLALLQGLVFIKFRTAPSPIGFEVELHSGRFRRGSSWSSDGNLTLVNGIHPALSALVPREEFCKPARRPAFHGASLGHCCKI